MVRGMKNNKKYSIPFRLACTLVVILLTGLFVEVGARVMFGVKDQIKYALGLSSALNLDEYEMHDPQHAHNWVLRRGFSETLEHAIEAAKKSGRVLKEQYLIERAPQFNIQNNDVVYRINPDGFRGPDIDKAHSTLRILTIGDSCTFGTPLPEKNSYPRRLERELRRMGFDVEVVNGGVEGYSPWNVLLRIEEFKALQPEITILYIGWNALFDKSWLPEDPSGTKNYYYTLRLFKRVYRGFYNVIRGPQQTALAQYNKPKHPAKNSPEIQDLDGRVPPFMEDIVKIVNEMQLAKSEVVLVTLPGLYTMTEIPSELALKKGHLPSFTDNPYMLAKMSEQYNIALRKLAKRLRLQVIDLDKWSEMALQPRDAFFC